jgi:hypothetical protein
MGAEDSGTSLEKIARCQSVLILLLLRDSAAKATSLSLNLASYISKEVSPDDT